MNCDIQCKVSKFEDDMQYKFQYFLPIGGRWQDTAPSGAIRHCRRRCGTVVAIRRAGARPSAPTFGVVNYVIVLHTVIVRHTGIVRHSGIGSYTVILNRADGDGAATVSWVSVRRL